MSFYTMAQELTGSVPKLPYDYARTIIQRATQDVFRKNLWSFQLFDATWVSPPLINAGTVTTVIGQNTVTFSSTAGAALNAVALSLTQRQFRVGLGTIYNIWQWDPVNFIATLDRPYMEASGTGQPYMVSQCYYAAPFQDFLTWISITDPLNYSEIDTNHNREWISARDPQRTLYCLPSHVVFYTNDQNPLSPTYRSPLFELWSGPLVSYSYQLYGIRRGAQLVNDTDQLPAALGEDCVMAKARALAYEWAEATKGDIPRNQGSDFRFLIQEANAEYHRLWREYRRQDRETVDNWYDIRRRKGWLSSVYGYYSSIAGVASPGAPW